MYSPEPEERVLPYTVGERRRIDRLDRAAFGYSDEAGVWVPGVLTSIANLREDLLRGREEDKEERAALATRHRQDDEKRTRLINNGRAALWALVVFAFSNFAQLSGLANWFRHLFGMK